MRLESVRALKKELRAVAGGGALKFTGSIGPWVGVSIGIAYGKSAEDYKLAIRFRSPVRLPFVERVVLQHIHITRGVPLSELDVQHTGPVSAIPLAAAGPNGNGGLRIGSSVSHKVTRAGTLGFFAEPTGGGTPLLVSANHVIGRLDNALNGDDIVHPGGESTNPVVANFVKISERLRGGGEKRTDAASAKLTTNNFDPRSLPNGKRLQQPAASLEGISSVAKISDRSGETNGNIKSSDFDTFEVLSYSHDLNFVKFEDQIEVESSSASVRFSNPGDSGAVVYDQDGHIIGLLFAETEQGGLFGNGFAYVNPIHRILSGLGVNPIT